MDWIGLIHIVLVLLAWVGGAHTAIWSSRELITRLREELEALRAYQANANKQYTQVVQDNAELRGKAYETQEQLKDALREVARLSADLDAIKKGDDG